VLFSLSFSFSLFPFPLFSLRRESPVQDFWFRCSATELQRLSSLAGIEPATSGVSEVTRTFTTPQTLVAGTARQSFFPMRPRRFSELPLRDSNP